MIFLSILISVCVPVIVAFCGQYLKKCSSREINDLTGYRSSRSRASREAWQFANDYCGRLWIRWSLISIIPSAAIAVIFCIAVSGNAGIWAATVIELIQVMLILVSIAVVEGKLKQGFDENGKPKAKEE
ncbi:MAG: SdpI family protein [Ruminococcus sp.]|nr:SdpI family protein [Ruminococcus sp.]